MQKNVLLFVRGMTKQGDTRFEGHLGSWLSEKKLI